MQKVRIFMHTLPYIRRMSDPSWSMRCMNGGGGNSSKLRQFQAKKAELGQFRAKRTKRYRTKQHRAKLYRTKRYRVKEI